MSCRPLYDVIPHIASYSTPAPCMEVFKSLDQLTDPDPRHQSIVLIDPSAPGYRRPLTLADQHARVSELELSESVPETIRSAYAVARMLWVHGWFYWPFYTLASFHAYLCLDMALAIRIAVADGVTDPARRTPSVTKMLERAVAERWVTDAGIAHAQRSREKAQRFVDSFPEEWSSKLAPNPWEESDQHYCKILAETIPKMRNAFAHPKEYWHVMYGSSRLDLENVHGLIQQLFPSTLVEGITE